MEHTFNLIDGITIHNEHSGEETSHKTVTLKALTAGETFSAQDASEELRTTPNGYELVLSPQKLSRELVRRSIKSIGTLEGISNAVFGKLSARDLTIMMQEYNRFQGKQNQLLEKRLKESADSGKP